MAARAFIALMLLAACSRERAAAPPLPADWALLAPEVRAAVEAAAERCRADPDDAEAFAELGRTYHGNHAFLLAIASYERALELRPDDARTLYFLGILRAERGETTLALERFEAARRIEPGYAPIRYHIGSALLEAGRGAEAIAAFRAAVEGDPASAGFRVGLARALRHAGKQDAALDACGEALRIDPGHVAAHELAARILTEQHRPEDAARHLKAVRLTRAEVVRDPWFRDVQARSATIAGRLAQADVFIESGKPQSAVHLLDPLSAAHADRADIHVRLARACALAGQLPQARAAYAKAVRAAPGDARTRHDFAHVLLDLGDLDGAAGEARSALAADPGLDGARVVLAAVALRRGDAEGALAELRAVIRTDLVLAHLVRGDALLALRRHAEAAAAFDAALKTSPGLKYAARRLQEARAGAAR